MKILLRSWFALTAAEHKALTLVVALLLLGIAARYLFLNQGGESPSRIGNREQSIAAPKP